MLIKPISFASISSDEYLNTILDALVDNSVLDMADKSVIEFDLDPNRMEIRYIDKELNNSDECNYYKNIIATKVVLLHLYGHLYSGIPVNDAIKNIQNYHPREYSKLNAKLYARYREPTRLLNISSLYFNNYYKFSLIKNSKYNAHDLLNELLAYHDKITSTENWQEIFKEIDSKNDSNRLRFRQGRLYHDAGFPKPSTKCTMGKVLSYNKPFHMYAEGDATLEAWFYSFWHRRYNDGLMDIVFKILTLSKKYN